MSKSLFKHAAATARCMRFLRARLAAVVLALALVGSLAGALSSLAGALSATSGVVSANGGRSGGGDPGNEIVLAGCGTICAGGSARGSQALSRRWPPCGVPVMPNGESAAPYVYTSALGVNVLNCLICR
jgi:hypothetical protein